MATLFKTTTNRILLVLIFIGLKCSLPLELQSKHKTQRRNPTSSFASFSHGKTIRASQSLGSAEICCQQTSLLLALGCAKTAKRLDSNRHKHGTVLKHDVA